MPVAPTDEEERRPRGQIGESGLIEGLSLW